MKNEHFEIIKQIKTYWQEFGEMENIEIPIGATHIMIESAEIDRGYYNDIYGVDVVVNFGRYKND